MSIDCMLIKVSAEENNNKFYHVTCDGSQITKRWGRVGSAGQSQSVSGGEIQAQMIINKKKREGYREVDISGSTSDVVSRAAKEQIAASEDPDVDAVIDYLVKKNRHEISAASSGKIVATDSGVSTPLGVISHSSIDSARSLLARLREIDPGTERTSVLEDYLVVVPQKIPHRRGWQDEMFIRDEEITAQAVLLDQMESALDASAATEGGVPSDVFRYRLDSADSKTIKRFQKRYDATAQHAHSHVVTNAKVSKVFTITDTHGRETFDEVAGRIGNVKHLWHGSCAHNILSILATGLRAPRPGDFNVTGAMFGPGTYFSETSTKSAGYCDAGYWTGGSADVWYLLAADVAAGWEYRPNMHPHASWSDIHSGKAVDKKHSSRRFDSINVKAGTCGVLNHEAVVWNPDQILLTHLIEMRS